MDPRRLPPPLAIPSADSSSARGDDPRNDLPLRSPSPTKIKTTNVQSPTKHKRIPSIELPPPKRLFQGRRNSTQESALPEQQVQLSPVQEQQTPGPPECKDQLDRLQDQQTPKAPFPGIWQALQGQHDLLMIITTEYLDPQHLFTLYCIDKDFHRTVDFYSTSWIRSAGRHWARIERPSVFTPTSESRKGKFVNAMRYVPLVCYPETCQKDKETVLLRPDNPADTATLRMNNLVETPSNPVPATLDTARSTMSNNAYLAPPVSAQSQASAQTPQKAGPDDNSSAEGSTNKGPRVIERLVPSFKYLFMVLERVATIRSILRLMAWDHGMTFPAYMPYTLLKLWFVMGVRTNKERTAFVMRQSWFTKFDLLRALMFFVKLDLICNDTITTRVSTWLRRLMLAQRSLVPLEHLLLRTRFKNRKSIEREAAKFNPGPGTEHIKFSDREVLKWEGNRFRYKGGLAYLNDDRNIVMTNRPASELITPDMVIIMETTRRRIPVTKREITFFITYGYPRRVSQDEIDDLEGYRDLTAEDIKKLPTTEQRPFWWKQFRTMCHFDRRMHFGFDLSREGVSKPPKKPSSFLSSQMTQDAADPKKASEMVVDFSQAALKKAPPHKSLMPQIPGDENLIELMMRVSREAGMGAPPGPPAVSYTAASYGGARPRLGWPTRVNERGEEVAEDEPPEPIEIPEADLSMPPPDMETNLAGLEGFGDSDSEGEEQILSRYDPRAGRRRM